ncbi:MAG: DUF58 domain-containing protein [Candidatus Hydrogenedentes bacterium]|nr:DUF58 domain-containing protein [Candidatus Hydrogenedentota bacterium]
MRPRRRLSRTGKHFTIIFVLVLLAAWNTGINLLYVVVSGLASFLILSVLVPGFTLRRLTVTREAPPAVQRMERFPVTVAVQNRKRFFPVVSVRIESSVRSGQSLSYIAKAHAQTAAVFRVSERFERRGVYPLPPLKLITTFPFGLLETSVVVGDPVEVVVYPRVLALRTALFDQLPATGALPKVAGGGGTEFFCLRQYLPGDELRKIAWRPSARAGTLIVRELEQETVRHAVFMFDTGRVEGLDDSDFENRFEDAVELVASLAVTLLQREYSVSLVTPTAQVEDGEGKMQIKRILEFLARVQPTHEVAGDAFFRSIIAREARGAAYFAVTADAERWGRKLGVGSLHVLDPQEVLRA